MSIFPPEQAVANPGFRWYALHVHSRKEETVASQLEGQGLECFLPLYTSVRKWSNRNQQIQQPLFPGYLFCRFNYQDRRAVVMTGGVLQVVGNGRKAIPVDDGEIAAIQLTVTSGVPQQPWPYLAVGERVRIAYGNLTGLEGILASFKGSHRVVLSVNLLQRSVAVEVDAEWLVPVRQDNPATGGNGILRPSYSGSLTR